MKDDIENIMEVIKCKCGKAFAACYAEYQDEEWIAERVKYLKGGCSVVFLKPNEFEFEFCNCSKTKEENTMQLSIFN